MLEATFNLDSKRKIKASLNIWAEQADGSCLLQLGETVVFSTVLMSKEEKDQDFFPLTVEYQERYYAAGKIFGSRFIRREAKPTDIAILTARLIDRAIRPLFPKNFKREVQVIVTVLSWDGENDPDVLGILATSFALSISPIPWEGPVGALRIGKKGNQYRFFPSYQERENLDFEIVVSGVKENEILINMIEGDFKETKEEEVLKAILTSRAKIEELINWQKEVLDKVKVEKVKVPEKELNLNLQKFLEKEYLKDLETALFEKDKKNKVALLDQIKEKVLAKLPEDDHKEALQILDQIYQNLFRANVLEKERRPDGRKLDEIRPIKCEARVLPRTHGSGLFERGLTKTLSILTLGSPHDAQLLEGMEIVGKKRFMHHYNFPPYAPGEIKPLRGPSRREIGHGALVERALLPVIPNQESFPYTIRIVSEVLCSNGSTSMASVCSSTLALMDAGVPIKEKVGGIAIGLVFKDKDNFKVLTDIQGPEDRYGDMDFKIAGTKNGITAIQVDTKIKGLTPKIILEALERGERARKKIIAEMEKVLSQPRDSLSPLAPKIKGIQVPPEKIGEIIGPGGKIINQIISETGVEIDIEEGGKIYVTAQDENSVDRAIEMIKNIVKEPEIGKIYQGKVKKILDFGAIVEISPGQIGLVHISQLAPYKVKSVKDIIKEGDIIPVKLIAIDERGRLVFSLKEALKSKRSF